MILNSLLIPTHTCHRLNERREQKNLRLHIVGCKRSGRRKVSDIMKMEGMFWSVISFSIYYCIHEGCRKKTECEGNSFPLVLCHMPNIFRGSIIIEMKIFG